MTAKDRYSIELKCPSCGIAGEANLSENDYRNTPPETHVVSLSTGFSVRREGGTLSTTEILCSKCGVVANG
jgi:DNA-directed RNA polymerase subunit M/transcription elongation factor TFIIS